MKPIVKYVFVRKINIDDIKIQTLHIKSGKS